MEAPSHITLQNPGDLTPEERRELAARFREARIQGDTIPGLTIRHIGQEAWVASNRLAPGKPKGLDMTPEVPQSAV